MKLFWVIFLFCLSCTRDGDLPVAPLGTGGITASQLNYRFSICYIIKPNEFGSALNGMSFSRSMIFYSFNVYVFNIDLYTGTACQTGGIKIFDYVQRGKFETGGLMDSPAGATQFIFTPSSSSLNTYATTPEGSLWAVYLNRYCPGSSLGLSTTADSTVDVESVHCLNPTSPEFFLPTFTAVGATLYDAIILNAGTVPVTLTTSSIKSIFEPGQGGTYPAEATLIYTAN